MTLQQQAEKLSEQTFLGVPAKDFERGGREQLRYLLAAGLNPDSKVVDLGCGVLRGGYWLIHFLNAGCYHGIEPHAGRLEIGMHTILEPEVLESKRPRFDTNPHFDTAVFGEKFDYFLAYSIWTHASKQHIAVMLDGFVRDSHDDGVFLATYFPAGWRHRDYRGDTWYGTSHESDVPGCIYHSFRWVQRQRPGGAKPWQRPHPRTSLARNHAPRTTPVSSRTVGRRRTPLFSACPVPGRPHA